jgi:hypothetical protein
VVPSIFESTFCRKSWTDMRRFDLRLKSRAADGIGSLAATMGSVAHSLTVLQRRVLPHRAAMRRNAATIRVWPPVMRTWAV